MKKEIVYCQDCEYREKEIKDGAMQQELYYCALHGMKPLGFKDFCCWGSKKN